MNTQVPSNVGQIAELVQANPLLKGSFFETLMKTMALKEFKQLPNDDDIKPGEIDLGKLNDYEKALVTMQINLQAEQKILVEQHNEAEPFAQNIRELQLAIKGKKDFFDTAQRLMWTSINQRLADKVPGNSSGVGIRKNDTIVAMPADINGGFKALMKALSSGFGGVMVVGPNGEVMDFDGPCDDPDCPGCSARRKMTEDDD